MNSNELKLKYLKVYADESATGTVAIGFPPGWFGDFHPAPKHQWMIATPFN